ncbi:Glycosyltransferase involved in cell wall bisynthesis [Prevotella communis]|uniref:Glycosyltransferase involved in cell wall bisynthesis n=1 Tax=Prevotella communis TaxID=2913614 RepID=A0A1H0G2Z4_9BACT|nr:glycosyltransferase [Prevotella communis]SDO01109.1 Glycosyltransferase involved in cell wall bisynthesis [Prevotella communis]
MPKVSVILPVYNVEAYLDEALYSLEKQTLKDIEIIAVNDGSTDNSLSILDKHALTDKRISIYSQKNKGLSGARNTGLNLCQGEYVYFMDSDDIIDKTALEECYNYAKKHDADVCLFDAEVFYEKDALQIPWDYNRNDTLVEDKKYEGLSLFNLLLDKEKHRAVVWLQFTRWEYLKKTKLNFYDGLIHEDELFTPQVILQTNRIYYLNRKFVKHRIRKSSIVGKGYSKKNLNCYLTVFDELFKFQDSPTIRKFARYTLSKVFYTGHAIPFKEKFGVFWRAVKSGYLKYIGLKSTIVFWVK